jgi:hypothetical protein
MSQDVGKNQVSDFTGFTVYYFSLPFLYLQIFQTFLLMTLSIEYGQIFNNKKKTVKGSGHNEHHEKVNKCKTLAEKDTMAMALSIKPVMYLVLVMSSYFADDWWED